MNEINLILILGISGIVLFLANSLSKLIKLPVILFYMLAGIAVSFFINIEQISGSIFQFGLIIIFFYIGMDFNLEKIFTSSKKIYKTGLIDIFLNFILIYIIFSLLGFNFLTSFAIAGIAYASSSAIATKIIIDNKRIVNPETDFILSLMVFEDILAPILLALITGFSANSDLSLVSILKILLRIITSFALIIVISKLFAKKLANFITHYISDEIIVLFVIGGMMLLAGLTHHFHLSEAIGGFLFGIFIAETGKSFEFERMLLPVRDFIIALFFLTFGAVVAAKENFDLAFLYPLIILLCASIVGKFLTGYFGGKIWGLSNRRSLIAGLSLIPRGEFSIAILNQIPLALYPFAALFILIISIIGTIVSSFAEKIVKKKKKV